MRIVVAEAAATSDVGRLRQSNEDALLVDDPVFAVADGMGGARAGEVASAMTVAALHGLHGSGGDLTRAITDVNRRIHAAAAADPTLAGMGTTVTAAILDGDTLTFGHVGDSRAYLLRDGRLSQITDDHSLVGELIRRGALSPAEAERHPQRSVITRALGAESRVDIDVVRLHPEAGDVILLCSDGLTGMVHDPEIERILTSSAHLEEAARRLIDAANAAGGEDNVSAVLLRMAVRDEDDTDPAPLERVLLPASAAELGPDGGPMVRDASPSDGGGRARTAGLIAAILALGVLAAALVAFGLRWAHFVGATPDGRVAVYQGLPIEITGDLALYRTARVSGVAAAALSAGQRRDLLDHRITSADAANARVDALATASPWLVIPPATR